MKLTLDAIEDYKMQVEVTNEGKANSHIFSTSKDFANDADKNHKIVDIMQETMKKIEVVLNVIPQSCHWSNDGS